MIKISLHIVNICELLKLHFLAVHLSEPSVLIIKVIIKPRTVFALSTGCSSNVVATESVDFK